MRKCEHCGEDDWSGFQCCDDCSVALARQFEIEDAAPDSGHAETPPELHQNGSSTND